MAHPPCLERKRAFRITSDAKVTPKRHVVVPSLAARIFRNMFQPRAAQDETRPKSWSGKDDQQPEPAPSTTKETLTRHASASVLIPSTSVVKSSRFDNTRRNRETSESEDEKECDSSWRQRQKHCSNCDRLFFTSLSPLCCNVGRFCSLDCKASFEYVHHLEEMITKHMLEVSGSSIDSLDSSLSDEVYPVEDFS